MFSKVDNNRDMKREKTGGRKAGTPNKTTSEIREAFNELVSSKLPELSKWLNEVARENPEKALEIVIKFSDFIIPKLQRTEIKGYLGIEQIKALTPEQREARILELKKKLIDSE